MASKQTAHESQQPVQNPTQIQRKDCDQHTDQLSIFMHEEDRREAESASAASTPQKATAGTFINSTTYPQTKTQQGFEGILQNEPNYTRNVESADGLSKIDPIDEKEKSAALSLPFRPSQDANQNFTAEFDRKFNETGVVESNPDPRGKPWFQKKQAFKKLGQNAKHKEPRQEAEMAAAIRAEAQRRVENAAAITAAETWKGEQATESNSIETSTSSTSKAGDAGSAAVAAAARKRALVTANITVPVTTTTNVVETTPTTTATDAKSSSKATTAVPAVAAATEDSSNKEDAKKEDEPTSKTTTPIFGSTSGFSGFGAASGTGFGTGTPGFGSGATTTPGFTFGNNCGGGTKTTGFGIGTPPGFTFGAAANKTEDTPSSATVALPESYTVQSGEEYEELLMEVECKSYKLDWVPTAANPTDATFRGTTTTTTTEPTKAWKETGVGELRVLRNSTSRHIRIVQRQPGINAVVQTIQRRPTTNIFDINGIWAVKLNRANAQVLQSTVVDVYFSSQTPTGTATETSTASPTKEEVVTSAVKEDGTTAAKEDETPSAMDSTAEKETDKNSRSSISSISNEAPAEDKSAAAAAPSKPKTTLSNRNENEKVAVEALIQMSSLTEMEKTVVESFPLTEMDKTAVESLRLLRSRDSQVEEQAQRAENVFKMIGNLRQVDDPDLQQLLRPELPLCEKICKEGNPIVAQLKLVTMLVDRGYDSKGKRMERLQYKAPDPIFETDEERLQYEELRQDLQRFFQMSKEAARYKEIHGNLKVPRDYIGISPGLGNWVHTQFAEFKKFIHLQPSTLTWRQILILEANGFDWQDLESIEIESCRSV